jgi:hypothetical protein
VHRLVLLLFPIQTMNIFRFSPVLATLFVVSGSLISLLPNASAAPPPSTVEQLADGNYRGCSVPPPTEQNVVIRGLCFRFSKRGDRVVGTLFFPQTSSGICVSGSVDGDIINGEATEYLIEDEPIRVLDQHQGSRTAKWDWDSFLMLGDGVVLESRSLTDGRGTRYAGTILYERASLDLSSFYRYTAGTQLPPTSCDR